MDSHISRVLTESIDLAHLTQPEARRALTLVKTMRDRAAQRLFYEIYPDEDTTWKGPAIMGGLFKPGQPIYSRAKYPKHMEVLDVGARYRERAAIFGNRCGKTLGIGGFETACHLTGLYPDWWQGKKFNSPISAWAAGDTYETTRDIMQLTLLGEITHKNGRKAVDGRGIIPGHLLGRNTWRSGVQDLVDTIVVRHKTGGNSYLGFKSTDQGRRAFQGTGRHWIWLDEECPMDVYGECLIRTATLGGSIMLTFTPIAGLTELALSFMPADARPDL